ncbi:MAG: SLC13 family permease, partial [Candidatus Omnitrophica bacterium]|nr:SLC13 family permease [Candidatus Omnitrophota bacterium]
SLSKRLKMNPVKIMIAIAISSNLQGAATLIGDPPSMLLAGAAKMNFIDFFFFKGKPSIFFAVELGAIASCMVLYLIFRKQKEKPAKITVEKIKTWFPTGVLIGLILILAGTSFLDTDFSYMAGAVSMLAAAVCFAWAVFEKKMPLVKGIKALDWDTTFFLGAVFIIVGAVTRAGWINIMAENLARVIGGNLFMGYTLLVIVAVLVSAVVDNVPFLAAMLPVAISVSEKIGAPPYLLLFGLLIGASLGGNITPIGASANIVACGLLKKEGYNVTFPEFMKIGVPFTLAAVSAGYIFLWMVWR